MLLHFQKSDWIETSKHSHQQYNDPDVICVLQPSSQCCNVDEAFSPLLLFIYSPFFHCWLGGLISLHHFTKSVMLFIPLFLWAGRKEKLAVSSPGLVTFPPVFGPYKTGLCLALCLLQVWIHADSWATLVQNRSDSNFAMFAFLLLHHQIFFDKYGKLKPVLFLVVCASHVLKKLAATAQAAMDWLPGVIRVRKCSISCCFLSWNPPFTTSA